MQHKATHNIHNTDNEQYDDSCSSVYINSNIVTTITNNIYYYYYGVMY